MDPKSPNDITEDDDEKHVNLRNSVLGIPNSDDAEEAKCRYAAPHVPISAYTDDDTTLRGDRTSHSSDTKPNAAKREVIDVVGSDEVAKCRIRDAESGRTDAFADGSATRHDDIVHVVGGSAIGYYVMRVGPVPKR